MSHARIFRVNIFSTTQTSQQDPKCPTFKESAQKAPKQIQRQLIHQEINSAPWAACTEQPCPWEVGCLKAQVKNCPSSWKCHGPAVNDPEANPCQPVLYFPPVKTPKTPVKTSTPTHASQHGWLRQTETQPLKKPDSNPSASKPWQPPSSSRSPHSEELPPPPLQGPRSAQAAPSTFQPPNLRWQLLSVTSECTSAAALTREYS